MINPETNTHYNNDPADRLVHRLEMALSVEKDPDLKQQALLTALINTLDEGVSPETFQRLEALQATLASTRGRAMGAAEAPRLEETEATTPSIPLHRGLTQAATHSPEVLTHESSAERVDSRTERWLDEEIVPYISHRAVYGKLSSRVFPRLNDQVDALSVDRRRGDDARVFGTESLGKLANQLYTAIHGIRSAERSWPGTYPDFKQAVVIGELPLKNKESGISVGSMVEVLLPANVEDHVGRNAHALVVASMLPEERADELLDLFADPERGADAVKAYLEKVAPGIEEDATPAKGGYVLTQEQTKEVHAFVRKKQGDDSYSAEIARVMRSGRPLAPPTRD